MLRCLGDGAFLFSVTNRTLLRFIGMHHRLFSFLLFGSTIVVGAVSAQTHVVGKVVSHDSQKPLSFVNVGVIGKDVGTVTDADGAFNLDLKSELNDDSIRFSMLGYKPTTYRVEDFVKAFGSKKALVVLEPMSYALKEVKVSDHEFKEKTLGNRTESQHIQGGFRSNQLGCEAGVLLKVKRSPTFVKDFYASVTKNSYDTLFFRLNFYSLKDGLPDKNILSQNIVLKTTEKSGLMHADLTPFNIVLDEDAVVSLEWLKDLGGTKGLLFSCNIGGGPVYFRQASQGEWDKESFAGIGYWVTVDQ